MKTGTNYDTDESSVVFEEDYNVDKKYEAEEAYDIEEDYDVEEPNRCDICGEITFTFTDAFCQKCFRKRRAIYVVLTIIVSLAVFFVAGFGSGIIGGLALGLDMISEAELDYTMEMSYNIIFIILILIYKVIMMKYVKSATVFVPSVLLFLFFYKTPQKSDKNNKVYGIERAAIK